MVVMVIWLLVASIFSFSHIFFLLFTKQQKFSDVGIEDICRLKRECNQKLKFVFSRVEHFIWKEESAGDQHFVYIVFM